MADCLVVILSGAGAQSVRRLWAEIGARWPVTRSHPDAEPHLTLAVSAEPVRSEALVESLADLAGAFPAFSVTGAGYGVFVRHDRVPVVHLALTKTPMLAALHEAVVHAVAVTGTRVDPESAPEFWRPHVNLADRDLEAGTVGRIMEYLVDQGPRHWTLDITNVSLLPASGEGGFSLTLAQA